MPEIHPRLFRATAKSRAVKLYLNIAIIITVKLCICSFKVKQDEVSNVGAGSVGISLTERLSQSDNFGSLEDPPRLSPLVGIFEKPYIEIPS